MLSSAKWPAAALSITILAAAPAKADSGAAERCMALPTDSARMECLVAALDKAERALERAGITAALGPQATTEQTDRPVAKVESPGTGRSGQLAELGAEQVAIREGKPLETDSGKHYPATIVRFRERKPGQMRFELDNGQIWQQTEADSQRLRLRAGKPLAVELWAAWSGGYRMLLLDDRMMVRVERVR